MGKQIKLTVTTGWADGQHVSHEELPAHWDEMSDKDKEEYLEESAQIYLDECCQGYAEVVEEIKG